MPSVALNLVLTGGRISSGDELQATVLLDSCDPDTVVSEFVAEVRGVGRTGWINIHTDKIYETEQEYLSIFLPLCPVNQTDMTLRPGRHQFSLRVLIPDKMPSSFESQFGSIRYTIKLSLLTNSESSSLSETFPFIVVARSSFDEIPQAIMQRIDYRDETDFTVCSLPFGTVYLVVSLSRTGFHLGEEISARIWIKNGTRKALKECRLALLLKTHFEAKSRYEQVHDRKLVEQVVDSWPLGKVCGRTEAKFKDCHLRVAEGMVPSQHLVGSELEPAIIQLSYVLRFNAEPGVETEIPIVITSDGYRQAELSQSHPHAAMSNSHGCKYGSQPEAASREQESHTPPRRRETHKRVSIFEEGSAAKCVSYRSPL